MCGTERTGRGLCTLLLIVLAGGVCLPARAGAQDCDEAGEELADELDELRATVAAASRLRFSGEARVRLRDVSSTGVQPVGPYGEPLMVGRALNHRALVELEADLAPGVSARVLLRLTDEGEAAFDAGPDRLASERGSAAVRYAPGPVDAVLGYYRLHLTPLLLMRWDLEDTPRGGGHSACACPGSGGAFTSESMEEMGPDLTLEGLRLESGLGDRFQATAFLARPRVAAENRSFARHTYGAVLRALAFHRPSASLRSAGVAVLAHRDDDGSVENALVIPYRPRRNRLLAAFVELPVGRRLRLEAEAVLSATDADLLSGMNEEENGHGVLARVELDYPSQVHSQAAFLRLSPGFTSLYNAVSYLPNRQGFRLSTGWDIRADRVAAWGFYKRLRELAPEGGEPRRTWSNLSFGGRLGLGPQLQVDGSLGFQREGDEAMDTILAELLHPLARTADALLSYQFLDHRNRDNPGLDYRSHQVLLLGSATF